MPTRRLDAAERKRLKFSASEWETRVHTVGTLGGECDHCQRPVGYITLRTLTGGMKDINIVNLSDGRVHRCGVDR